MIRSIPVEVVVFENRHMVVEWTRRTSSHPTRTRVPLEVVPLALRVLGLRLELLVDDADVVISQNVSAEERVVGILALDPAQTVPAERYPMDWYCQACGRFSHHTDSVAPSDARDAESEHSSACVIGLSMTTVACCAVCHQQLEWGENLCSHQAG